MLFTIILMQVSIACKDRVPEFGPYLCSPPLFKKGPEFRDWVLTKLLNAEFNCHKAPDFLKLAVGSLTVYSKLIYYARMYVYVFIIPVFTVHVVLDVVVKSSVGPMEYVMYMYMYEFSCTCIHCDAPA